MNETDNLSQDLPQYLRDEMQAAAAGGNPESPEKNTATVSPEAASNQSLANQSLADELDKTWPSPGENEAVRETNDATEAPGTQQNGGNNPDAHSTQTEGSHTGSYTGSVEPNPQPAWDSPSPTPSPTEPNTLHQTVALPAPAMVETDADGKEPNDALPAQANPAGENRDATPEEQDPSLSQPEASENPEAHETAASEKAGKTSVTPDVAVNNPPTPYPLPEAPQLATVPETETTMVRRKSLLNGLKTDTTTPQDHDETEPQWQPRPVPSTAETTPPSLNEATVLAGASIKPAKISRVSAHITSLLVCLIGLPFVWSFLKHAGGLLYSCENSTWATGRYSVEGLVFLALGLVLIVLIGLAVRLSSLGSFLSGIILILVGIPPVVAPAYMKDFLEPTLTWLSNSTVIMLRNLSYFLESSAFSGQFLIFGVFLVMIGVVGHTARRRGRTDQIAEKALAKLDGLQPGLQ